MLKFKVTKSPLEQQIKIVEAFLNKMAFPASTGSYSVLLSGDPGVGKTSFLRQLGTLLACELMIIEAPHVLQEHLVNIPFLVYEPTSNTPHTGTITQTEDSNGTFHLAFSKSYLIQGLKGAHKIKDDQYIDYIYKQSPHIIKLYEALGGTKEEAPEEILDARELYKDILFIDEYFRAPSENIRNALRGILNRQIGETTIPKTTFIAFASNMNDEGISEISSHQVYTKVEMDRPSKEGWFSWLMDKYLDHDKVQLKDEVLNKFYEIMEEKHLSHSDIETEIRTSPRRWEQLILYVNDSLPVKHIEDANALLANVKSNFTNTDGQYSSLHEGVLNAVKELIKETSGDKISEVEMKELGKVEHDKWKDHLKHQIERKINLGEHRSYVPVVSGAPGIGKNAKIADIATELNLGVVMINSMNVSADDVIGTPITKGKPSKDKPIEMEFHTPKLLHDIQAKVKALESEMEHKPNQKIKYMIYFDELDKVKDIQVFNSLRKVILEKEFANGEKLPEESVVVAAINPSGTEGTQKFTGHMSDVMDIVHAEPNWKEFVKHIATKNLPEKLSKNKDKLQDLLETFANKFKSQGKDGYWNIEIGGTEAYISPRDYTNMFQDSLASYARIVKKVEKEETDDLTKFNNDIKDAVFSTYEQGLGALFDKAHLDSNDFMEKLKMWFRGPDTDMLLKDVTMRKVASKNEIQDTLKKMMEDAKYNPVNGEDSMSQGFIAYMDSVEPTEFATHLREFVAEHIKADEKSMKPTKAPKHNYVDPDSKELIPTNELGLVQELKHGFIPTSDNSAKDTLKTYLDVLMEHSPKFKKDVVGLIEDYNEKHAKEPFLKLESDKDISKFIKDIFEDADDKVKNPVTNKAKEVRKWIETKEDDKYTYLLELIKNHPEFIGEPLSTASTHENFHKFVHNAKTDKPVEEFINRVYNAIDELDLSGQFKDTVSRELEDELKQLEDEYLLKHVETFA